MVIAGAGGHALEILDILLESVPKEKIVFFDDVSDVFKVHDYFPVLKNRVDIEKCFIHDRQFCLGVGNISKRKILNRKMTDWGGELVGVQSRTADVSSFSSVDSCADICKQVFISSLSTVGYGSLINNGAKVHHHVNIGEFCEISPAVVLLGGVLIGNECFLGSGSIVLPKISICSGTVIGAGTVVIKSIIESGTYVGVPAERIK